MVWKSVSQIAKEYEVGKSTILRWIHLAGIDYKVDEKKNTYYIDDEDPKFRRLLSFHKTKTVNGKKPLHEVAKMYGIPHTTLYYYTIDKKLIPYESFTFLNRKYIMIDPNCPELKKLIKYMHTKPFNSNP